MKTSTTTLIKLFLLSTVLIFSLFNQTIAQITIDGTITDPDLNPIDNALVEIYDQNDSLKIYSATTNASGYFIISNITDIKNSENSVPKDYLFIRNYPNPFNPSTIIHYELPKAENIEIKIYDILGREIRTLFNGFHDAGADQINWDGRNNFNRSVSAGIYLCQLKTKDHFKVHKMVLLDGGTSSSGSISFSKLSKQNLPKASKINSNFNFTIKITGNSLDATYYRNLVCTGDTTLNLIASKIITTETIGIEGGVVGNDDFMISIPAGAFDGSYDISLIKIEDDGAFGENTVTPSFKISGIPNNYSKPIKIIGKYSGELLNNSFLSVGARVYDPIYQDSVVFYNLIETNDSSGNLISEIPVDTSTSALPKISYNMNLSDFQLDHFLKFVHNLKYSVTQHFHFDYQSDTEVDMMQVATIFENAFEVVYAGLRYYFELNYDTWNHPPLKVKLINMPEIIKDQGFRHNQNFNANLEMLKNNNINEVQYEVVKRLFLPTKMLDELTFWGDLPIYFWIEDLLSEENNDYPKANGYQFLEYGFEPIKGFKLKESNIIHKIKHGVGMSVFLKYLYEIQNYSIKNMTLFMRSERNSELMNLIVQWWPDFIKRYINNELYTLPDDYFIKNAQYNWDISSELDTLKKFTSGEVGTYQDLSAKIFKVNLNYADLDSTRNLKFKMIGPENNKDLSLILFKIKDNKLEFIDTTKSAEYEIINPKSYFVNGTGEFLAVVVNSNITQDDYLGQSDIDLEVTVSPKINISDFDMTSNKCIATIAITADLQIERDGSTENKTELLIFSSENTTGSFEGNIYTGSYFRPGTTEGSYFSGEISVTLNEAHDTIVTASFTGLDEDPYWGTRWEKAFTAENIPLSPYESNVFTFQYDNTNVCNSIKNVNYVLKQFSGTTRYINHSCDEFSNVSFRFSKE